MIDGDFNAITMNLEEIFSGTYLNAVTESVDFDGQLRF